MGGGGLNLQNGTFRLSSNVTMPLSAGGLTIPGTAVFLRMEERSI